MDRCPSIKTVGNADESLDYCEIDEVVCMLVGGNQCALWESIKKEEAESA